MENGFRIAGTLKEFLQDLEDLKSKEHEFTIWQNNDKGDKLVLEGSYESYNLDKDNTIVSIRLEKNQTFEKDYPVYLLEKAKGILFKGRYEFCVNSILKILAEDRIFLREKRSEKRFYFHHTSVKTLLNSHHLDDSKTKVEDQVELRDVSPGGFSFKVSAKRAKMFKVETEVDLLNIGGIPLPKAIEGTIIHITAYKELAIKSNEEKLFNIGVQFKKRSKLFNKVIEALKQEL